MSALHLAEVSQGSRAAPLHGTPLSRSFIEDAFNGARPELVHLARVFSLAALTASIAHEVSQPLSGILANAGTCLRMLAADPPDIAGARETARRTVRDGKRASDVITRLRLLFSRQDAVTDNVDLNSAASEVMGLLLDEMERRRVLVRLCLAADLPLVTGDPVQLQQVILNLVLNAADAMSEVDGRPRELTVTTGADGHGGVHLSVQDTGVGIQPDSLHKIFEPFYTTKSKGMGIGLAVSRSIVESHQGRLWAACNAGPGASFFMSLPAAAAGAVTAGLGAGSPGIPGSGYPSERGRSHHAAA